MFEYETIPKHIRFLDLYPLGYPNLVWHLQLCSFRGNVILNDIELVGNAKLAPSDYMKLNEQLEAFARNVGATRIRVHRPISKLKLAKKLGYNPLVVEYEKELE